MESPLADYALATIHPSSVLRQRTPADRRREREGLARDLAVASRVLKGK